MNAIYLKSILCAATLAMAAGSCTNKKAADSTSGNAQVAATGSVTSNDLTVTCDSTITWTDSVKIGNGNEASCQINMSFPSGGPEQTVESIRKWISERLSTAGGDSPDAPMPYAAAAADYTDGAALAKSVGNAVLAQAGKELKEFAAEMDMPAISYEYIWNIVPSYETDSLITYTASTYAYLGGAHGSSFAFSQVFAKPSGKRLGWNNMFKSGSTPELLAKIKNGLKSQYFEVSSDRDFADCLLVKPDELTLPIDQPAFLADGVAFTYQQYEIAPYSSGMPSCVVSYDDILPLLNPDVARLIPANKTSGNN